MGVDNGTQCWQQNWHSRGIYNFLLTNVISTFCENMVVLDNIRLHHGQYLSYGHLRQNSNIMGLIKWRAWQILSTSIRYLDVTFAPLTLGMFLWNTLVPRLVRQQPTQWFFFFSNSYLAVIIIFYSSSLY